MQYERYIGKNFSKSFVETGRKRKFREWRVIAPLRSNGARPRNRPRNNSTRIDRGGFYAADTAEKPRRPPSVVPLPLSPPPSPAFFSACTREISLPLSMHALWESCSIRERERENRVNIFRETKCKRGGEREKELFESVLDRNFEREKKNKYTLWILFNIFD